MGIHEDVIMAWGGSLPKDAEDTCDNIVAVLINEVEHRKSSQRREYEMLKEVYLAGSYRQHGYSKRDIEDTMHRLSGQIMGYEGALAVLYLALSDNKATVNHGA